MFNLPVSFTPVYMFSEAIPHPLPEELIAYITAQTNDFNAQETFAFLSSHPLLARALATMPEVNDFTSGSSTPDQLFPFILWLQSNEDTVMLFQARIMTVLPEAHLGKFIRDLFSLRLLRQGLVMLGADQPEALIRFMNLYRIYPFVIDCLNEILTITSLTPIDLMSVLETSAAILEEYIGNPLSRQAFVVLLLKRLARQKRLLFLTISKQSAQEICPALMNLLENTVFPDLQSVANSPEYQGVNLLILNLLQGHQHLVPLIYPASVSVSPLDAMELILALESAIQLNHDVKPLLVQLLTHPELIEQAFKLCDNRQAFEQVILNASSYENLQQTMTNQLERQVLLSSQKIIEAIQKSLIVSSPKPAYSYQDSHLIRSSEPFDIGKGLRPFTGPGDYEEIQQPSDRFSPEGFASLLEKLRYANPEAYDRLIPHSRLRERLLSLYLNQGDALWLNEQALEIAAALLEEDVEPLEGESLIRFLLRFFEQLRANNIYPFRSVDFHSRSYPRLVSMLQDVLKKVLVLANESDTSATARTILILLGQDPNAVSQLFHQVLHISCPANVIQFLGTLEEHAELSSNNEQQLLLGLQVILAHPGLLVPICAMPDVTTTQLPNVLALISTIDPHLLLSMPPWQLQILTGGLAATLQATESTPACQYIPKALTEVLSEIISQALPAALPYISQLQTWLIQLLPDIEWDIMNTREEFKEALIEALTRLILKPEDLEIFGSK